MGDFLTAVKTVTLRPKGEAKPSVFEEVPATKPLILAERVTLKAPEDALETLKSRPDSDSLEEVLIYLSRRQDQHGFSIRLPSPTSAKITNELISTTIPDFWQDIGHLENLMLDTLRTVAGIGAIIARLRFLTSQYKLDKRVAQSSNAAQPISDLINILSGVLRSDNVTYHIFTDIKTLVQSQVKRDLLWKEYLASVATGKVVSAVAEAEDVISTNATDKKRSWLSDGSQYSAWLGRNVAYMARKMAESPEEPVMKAAAQMCGRVLNLGYGGGFLDFCSKAKAKCSLSQSNSLNKYIPRFRYLTTLPFLYLRIWLPIFNLTNSGIF